MPREGARRRSRPSPQLQPQPAPIETDPDIADEEQKTLEAAIAASLSDAMSTNFASQLASMEDFDDGFPNSFLCPITSELMREPVSTDEGHCYEHAAIKEWLALSHISPSTGLQLQSAKLTPAHALRNSIQEYCADRFGALIMADDIKWNRQQSSDVVGMPEGLKPFKGLLRFHRKTQSSLCHSSPSQSDGSTRRRPPNDDNEAGDEWSRGWVTREVALLQKSKLASATTQARRLARLAHPRVLQLLGLYGLDEGWLVVTEAAALCSLQDALGAGDLNRDMTLGHRLLVLSQVSSAMEVVAAAGLVHCYLSLDNVVLSAFDRDDVSGLSVKLSGAEYMLSIQGGTRDDAANSHTNDALDEVHAPASPSLSKATLDPLRLERVPAWLLAPECIADKSVSQQSDIWAFGVLAWQLYAYASSAPLPPPAPYTDKGDEEVRALIQAGSTLARPRRCPLEVLVVCAAATMLARVLPSKGDEYDEYACKLVHMAVSVGMTHVALSLGALRLLVRASGIESAPGLRLCGMRGLAQLAGDDRAHSDMARARVDASMIELMRRPQVLRTIAQRDTDLFAAALSRATAVREKEELARLLADSRQRLQQTSGQLPAHASQTMAWGSVVLARLARESSGMPRRIAAGGGVEALVVGLTRSQRMDKSVVLDSMCTIMQATSGVVEPWRAMLRPVLETLEEISEDRRLQMNGFRVIREFASDSDCQRIIADNLDAIMVGLAWHQRPPDQALQQAGLEILLKMVDSEKLDDASLGGTSGDGYQGEEATVAAPRPGKKAGANGLTVGVSRLTVGVSAIPVAVRSLQTYESRKLQLTVVRLFASLAHNEPTNRNLIVSSGGVEAVFAALRANSDDADFQTHGLKFVSAVAWSEGQIQGKVLEEGGVSLILGAMGSFPDNSKVQAAGCLALMALVRKGDVYARNAALRAGALAAVKTALQKHISLQGAEVDGQAIGSGLRGRIPRVTSMCSAVVQMLVMDETNTKSEKHAPSGAASPSPPPAAARGEAAATERGGVWEREVEAMTERAIYEELKTLGVMKVVVGQGEARMYDAAQHSQHDKLVFDEMRKQFPQKQQLNQLLLDARKQHADMLATRAAAARQMTEARFLFDRLDQDRSGALDAGELKRFALTDGGYKADEDNGLALLRDITRGDVSAMSVKQMREELVALRKFEDGEATKFTLEGKDIDRINWSQFRRADLEAIVLKARNHATDFHEREHWRLVHQRVMLMLWDWDNTDLDAVPGGGRGGNGSGKLEFEEFLRSFRANTRLDPAGDTLWMWDNRPRMGIGSRIVRPQPFASRVPKIQDPPPPPGAPLPPYPLATNAILPIFAIAGEGADDAAWARRMVEEERYDELVGRLFERLDGDSSASLTWDEAKSSSLFASGSAKISSTRHVVSRAAGKTESVWTSAEQGLVGLGEFKQFDLDTDGELRRDEFQVLAMVKYYRVLKDVTGTVTDSDKEFSKFYPWKYNALFKVKRWMEDFDSG